jgi:hypothetical protein
MDYVQFFHSGTTEIATDNIGPDLWSVAWDTTQVLNGEYTLHAVAYDTSGNSTPSASITVTVDNPEFIEFAEDGIITSISGLTGVPFIVGGNIDSITGLSALPLIDDGVIDSITGLSGIGFIPDGAIDSILVE